LLREQPLRIQVEIALGVPECQLPKPRLRSLVESRPLQPRQALKPALREQAEILPSGDLRCLDSLPKHSSELVDISKCTTEQSTHKSKRTRCGSKSRKRLAQERHRAQPRQRPAKEVLSAARSSLHLPTAPKLYRERTDALAKAGAGLRGRGPIGACDEVLELRKPARRLQLPKVRFCKYPSPSAPDCSICWLGIPAAESAFGIWFKVLLKVLSP
jgi:hypothetical protein